MHFFYREIIVYLHGNSVFFFYDKLIQSKILLSGFYYFYLSNYLNDLFQAIILENYVL